MSTTTVRIPSTPSASAILPLILVFLCGVTVGALAMNLGIHRALRHSPPIVGHQPTLEAWKKQLDLTTDQTRQIELILDDFSKYYDNVLSDGNSRILQVLDDRQKVKFQKMIKDRRQYDLK